MYPYKGTSTLKRVPKYPFKGTSTLKRVPKYPFKGTAAHVSLSNREAYVRAPVKKEKPARKTQLEKPLVNNYPGLEEEIVNRILKQKLDISVGEYLVTAAPTTECLSKSISNKRVPIGSTEDQSVKANIGQIDQDEEEEDQKPTTHYACPLGYIKFGISGEKLQGLLDTGSMVNIIPEELAQQLGLLITEKPMNLRGVGGHTTGITGIAENVEVFIGNIIRPAHFWVAKGPVKLILGKPFFTDAQANFRYNEEGHLSLSIKDSKGQSYLVPIVYSKNERRETSLPCNHYTAKDFS